jgi:hypothetical protein
VIAFNVIPADQSPLGVEAALVYLSRGATITHVHTQSWEARAGERLRSAPYGVMGAGIRTSRIDPTLARQAGGGGGAGGDGMECFEAWLACVRQCNSEALHPGFTAEERAACVDYCTAAREACLRQLTPIEG